MAQTKVKLISDGVIDVNHLASGHSITTDNIGEGSNLYYTDARVSTYLSTNSYATESYVTTAVANLVDSAPTTLDTLNELAAALGDDPNFATTVTNSIATKLPLAGGNITGNLTVDTNTLYVDVTSNRVGIGTSSPDSNLHISTAFPEIRLQDNAYPATNHYSTIDGNGGSGVLTLSADKGNTAANSSIDFYVDNSLVMRADNGGNVGIGNSNPLGKLQITSGDSGASSAWTNADELILESSDNVGLAFQTPNTGAATIAFQDPESVQAGFIQYLHADNALRFATNGNNERLRIDSSGRVLVGKASSNFASTGVEIRSDEVLVTRTGGVVLSLNRLSNDGDIIALVKDSSTVGRIGAFTGESYIGTRNTGFHFNDTGDQILPFDPQNVTYRDNGIDLGQSAYRWKNLWLSGAVYLGGTAAANALDDYEEGTWTPVLKNAGTTTYAVQSGSYTKIGNLVVAHCHLNVGSLDSSVASSNLSVSGLPFTSSFRYAVTSSIHTNGWSSTQKPDNGIMSSGINWVDFYKSLGQTGVVSIINDYIGGGNILFTISYTTS